MSPSCARTRGAPLERSGRAAAAPGTRGQMGRGPGPAPSPPPPPGVPLPAAAPAGAERQPRRAGSSRCSVKRAISSPFLTLPPSLLLKGPGGGGRPGRRRTEGDLAARGPADSGPRLPAPGTHVRLSPGRSGGLEVGAGGGEGSGEPRWDESPPPRPCLTTIGSGHSDRPRRDRRPWAH